jgi:hypothetical protein
MVTLYQAPFEKRYTSRLLSCSTIFVGISFLLTLIIPYIIVYVTNGKFFATNTALGMWKKESFYFE